MSTTGWIVLGVLVVIVIWAISVYNSLVAMRQRTDQAFADIDVQLKQRHDLIPNLVETVKGYATHERGTLEAVIQARNTAVAAPGVEQKVAAENMLTGALRQLFAVAEAYPDLKANQNFLALQQELASTEDRIAAGRRYYNANVRELNTKVESVPSNIIAGLAHIGRAEYFEAEGAQREAPQVSFGGPGSAPGQIGGGAPAAPTTGPGPQDTVRPSSPLDPPPGR
jgi:LemA protein